MNKPSGIFSRAPLRSSVGGDRKRVGNDGWARQRPAKASNAPPRRGNVSDDSLDNQLRLLGRL
ncbi:hypothetical protein ASF79_00905 [Agreia sp. Leaf335]|nr:hypothetical protein ASF79_00905 [Agreia sp. Leaf335]